MSLSTQLSLSQFQDKIYHDKVHGVYMALSFYEKEAKNLFQNHHKLLDQFINTFPTSTLYNYRNAHLSVYIENEQSVGLTAKNLRKALSIKDQEIFLDFCDPTILCSQKIEYCYLTMKALINHEKDFYKFWTELGGSNKGTPHISLLRIKGEEMQKLDQELHPVDIGYPDMQSLNKKFYSTFSPSTQCVKMKIKEAHLEFANTPGAKDGSIPISDRVNYIDQIYENLMTIKFNHLYNEQENNICPINTNPFE